MTTINVLSASDLEQMFADWGVAVILRQVTQTASPATGLIDETAKDTYVTAVVRSRLREPTRGTAMRHSTDEVDFVLRAGDLPAGVSLATSRVVHQGREYSITGATTSADGGIVIAQGQRA